MKPFFNVMIMCIIISFQAYPQIFTKVTTGKIVNDGGDSRAVNWIDYDNDDDLDLYITNGPQSGQNNFFYINNGDGTFTKDSLVAIANDGKASDGSSWGDYDNDGDVDLFVANWWNHNNLLYRNNGDKTFTLITDTKIYTDRGYSETGSWGDYDKDGFIDLYVCNSGGSLRNFFYRNNGDGTFTSIITGSMVNDRAASRNIDWIDIDNDKDDDIFVANEENQNENLYQNNSDGTFTKISSGALVTSSGNSAGSIWEDFDNDGDFDVFITNWGNQDNFYFVNNGDGTFTRITSGTFVNDGGSSFGSAAGDIDNDGDVDLYVANAFTGSSPTNNFLYLNNGDGSFQKISDDVSVNDGGWSYGCSFGDYNKDGYLDLFLGKCFNANENNSLFKNNGGSNNWFVINLEGKRSNRSAIGAIVKIKADVNGNETWQIRRVAGQNGYCGQNLQIHFGLGNASQVDSVEILWPSGILEKHGSYASNKFLRIVEDTTLTGIGKEYNIPPGFELYQNYPNPFNPSTTIGFGLPAAGNVNVSIYNSLGERISELINETRDAGYYEVMWNADNLASGIYFYSIYAIAEDGGKDFRAVKKMLMIK